MTPGVQAGRVESGRADDPHSIQMLDGYEPVARIFNAGGCPAYTPVTEALETTRALAKEPPMNRTRTLVMAGALAAAITLPLSPANAGANQGHKTDGYAVAVRRQEPGRLRARQPGKPVAYGKITGLTGDTMLVGIDFRVQDKALYGVGDEGGVYTLSAKAKATKVSQLTVALSGTKFGVDFNPAADRLRVVSDNGQNLRHDVNPGGATIVDGTLTYPPATTPASGVSGAAYTNNDLDAATATTLFDPTPHSTRWPSRPPPTRARSRPPASPVSTPAATPASTSRARTTRATPP